MCMCMKRMWLGAFLAIIVCGQAVHAKDLGEILLKKGLITPEELRQAQAEEKQKVVADESRRDAIVAKLPKWLDYITLFGDVRLRYEGFFQRERAAENRFRLRARIGLAAKVTDAIAGAGP